MNIRKSRAIGLSSVLILLSFGVSSFADTPPSSPVATTIAEQPAIAASFAEAPTTVSAAYSTTPVVVPVSLTPAQPAPRVNDSASGPAPSTDQKTTTDLKSVVKPAHETAEQHIAHVETAPKPALKPIIKPAKQVMKMTLKPVAAAKPAAKATYIALAQSLPEPENIAFAQAEDSSFMSRVMNATTGIINRAVSWLGTRYRWGGSSKRGIDCSGLTKQLYKGEGIGLPHNARLQFKKGQPIARTAMLPGDLVFFNTRGPLTHVGIYIGNNKFVHASNPRRGVRVDSLGSAYYNKFFAGARRYKSIEIG